MRYAPYAFLAALLLLVRIGTAAEPLAKPVDADSPLPPAEAASTMRVADGFEVTLFAAEPDVRQPIGFCIDDRARLWVAEAYNYPVKGNAAGDRIVILEDSDGDGRHDQQTVFYDQLNYVTGIEVGFGGAWVMSPPNLLFIPDRDHDDVPDGEPVVVLDGFGTHANAHNLANGFAWGPDGWLYGTHGRTNWSMIGKPGTPEQDRTRFDGGVYRYHPVRDVWEPYADGMTNPWGLDWNDYGHAFACNCVNPHLFQIIQGAHYEPWRGRQSSQFAYERIDTIADHLHFVGLADPRSGLGSDAEDTAGGGHAHCGTLIYLADDFPARYRNQLLTNNIHGKRINNDLLHREGSGYVASHGPDFAVSADPWFVGVTLAQGPAGEIYCSDWSDTGECHHTRNTQRETGRLFRVTYGHVQRPAVDIANLPSDALVDLHQHRNDWFVRHARRVLQERAAAGDDLQAERQRLREMLAHDPDVTRRLRALWTLHATRGIDSQHLTKLLADPDEHLREWAVKLLCEPPQRAPEVSGRLVDLAMHDPSPLVRLALASGLQRMPPAERWPVAEALAAHGEDADDANLPRMVWYGVEPLIEDDLTRFAALTVHAAIPTVRRLAARRLASSTMAPQGVATVVQRLTEELHKQNLSASHVADVLQGLLTGFEGRRKFPMPADWRALSGQLQDTGHADVTSLQMRLALRFGDATALAQLRTLVADHTAAPQVRRQALQSLVDLRDPQFDSQLLRLLDDPDIRSQAIEHLPAYAHAETADQILKRFASWNRAEQSLAMQTLASRVEWAKPLVAALEAGRIDASSLDAFTARQLHALPDADLADRVDRLWGNIQPTSGQLTKQISRYKSWLADATLRQADLQRGQALFKQHCGNCHRMFGEGGQIGPDLSGAQRTNLDYLLENIVAPSASVSKDYQMQTIVTVDGRVITGMVESDNATTLTLLTATERIVLPADEVESRKQTPVSMMPTGLLDPLSDREIRDLIGYLQR